MPDQIEHCANCGNIIGKLETPHVWRSHVVCAECYHRLNVGQAASLQSLIDARSAEHDRRQPPSRSPRPTARYVDRLVYPRIVIMLLAVAASFMSGGGALLLWAAWFALLLVSIVQKANFQGRQSE